MIAMRTASRALESETVKDTAVFGIGYVGCVTAACLGRDGHRVVGVDVDAGKVAELNDGVSPIREPGLDDLIADQEARAGALRRQARQAERYRALSDQIRTAEARMIFARWRDAAAAAEEAKREAARLTALHHDQPALRSHLAADAVSRAPGADRLHENALAACGHGQ